MVLYQAEIDSEFPNLILDGEASGYQDREAVAEDTINPYDTAFDLAMLGRLNGYETSFFDPEALAFDSNVPGRPFGIVSTVHLMQDHQLAQEFVHFFMDDYRTYQGIDMDGGTLEGFVELDAPDLGSDEIAFRTSASVDGLEVTFYISTVGWVRGPVRGSIVATITAVGLDDKDLSGSLTRLAFLMNESIDGVLAGEVTATPILPIPTATAGPSGNGSAALAEGYDLPEMLITLADLPDGVILESEGFLGDHGTAASYERDFGPDDLVFELGTSQLMVISASVDLLSSELDSLGLMLVLRGLGSVDISS